MVGALVGLGMGAFVSPFAVGATDTGERDGEADGARDEVFGDPVGKK
eukprot:gene6053-2384_t